MDWGKGEFGERLQERYDSYLMIHDLCTIKYSCMSQWTDEKPHGEWAPNIGHYIYDASDI